MLLKLINVLVIRRLAVEALLVLVAMCVLAVHVLRHAQLTLIAVYVKNVQLEPV